VAANMTPHKISPQSTILRIKSNSS